VLIVDTNVFDTLLTETRRFMTHAAPGLNSNEGVRILVPLGRPCTSSCALPLTRAGSSRLGCVEYLDGDTAIFVTLVDEQATDERRVDEY
jgi:hypothetical protein